MIIIEEDADYRDAGCNIADYKITDAVLDRVHPRCTPEGKWYMEGTLAFLPDREFKGTMPSRLTINQLYKRKYKKDHSGRLRMTITITHLDTIDGVYTYVVEGEETKK